MKLLPDSIKLFLINRILEISGITTVLLSFFILISVISYSSFDPSILNVNNYEVKNIGGYIWATVSDVLIQFFGYNSILICIILISWAYKLFFVKSLEKIQKLVKKSKNVWRKIEKRKSLGGKNSQKIEK